jgi:hypothetical protein|tara:strand:+ start:178 stop:294 length:117 start_codon:yes stop_codon:yes gene_type:complete
MEVPIVNKFWGVIFLLLALLLLPFYLLEYLWERLKKEK